MSKTRLKNGQRVYESMLRVGQGRAGVMRNHFIAREIVEESGLSKPTVLKYLRIMEQCGTLVSVVIGRGTILFKIAEGISDAS